MKIAVLIDGGHLRACAKAANRQYDNALIEGFAKNCVLGGEYLFRVYYYDSPQYRGTVRLPVSGASHSFSSNDKWLDELARLERFAVRRGTIGFRGWKPRSTPVVGGQTLTDADFSPIFEQKGVDMRIGLDIATAADTRAVDRLLLVSGDTDMIPAMKHARKAGLEVAIVRLDHPAKPPHDTLLEHADLVRQVAWP